MEFPSLRKYDKIKIEVCTINLTILLYLFRTTIPLLKFPFLILYIGIIAYSVINYRKRLYLNLIEFIRNYYLLLILAFILIISFVSSNKLYLTVFKDVFNTIILISLFYISSMIVSEKKDLKIYISNLLYLIIIFASVISIAGLMNLLNIFSFNLNNGFTEININTSVESVEVDYNFAIVPVFFGLFGVFYLLRKNYSKLQIVIFNSLLVIFSLNILLSGSRRGMILFLIIVFILLFSKLVFLFRKRGINKVINFNYNFFLLSVFTLGILLNLFFFHSSDSFKSKTLASLGTKNVIKAKSKLLINIYRYISAINKVTSFSDLGWTIIYDPKEPDSGWGYRNHKTIFPLEGKNVNIVPDNTKGYLMDSTCNGSYYPTIDLCESYTMMVNLNVNKGDKIRASVYCFVSDSFDVNSVSLGVGSASIANKTVLGKFTSEYNFNSRGVWQKLEIDFDCIDGVVPIYLSFWKKGVKNFSKIKGHIIFAYPTYEKIKLAENRLSFINNINTNENATLGKLDLVKNTGRLKSIKSLDLSDKAKGQISSFIIDYTDLKLHFSSDYKVKILSSPTYAYSSISGFSLSILTAFDSILTDNDPIRKLVSKLVSEDTTYFPYKANIILGTFSSPFIGDRALRWEFAIKLFTKEFSWEQKIFGGGFNFLNWHGFYFLKDKTASDWPHNPFLSILLYSGIFGLSIYCFFLYKVFYYYIKYIKEYPLLFIFFLITFFFSFFSGGSPFDPPIMGFFSILPFFIHAVHKKGKSEAGSQESEVVIKE